MTQPTSSLRTTSRDVHKIIRPLRAGIIRLIRDLVRVNTVAVPPHGNETPAQLVLREFLREHNVRSELYEIGFVTRSRSRFKRTDRNYSGRKNLVASLPGSGRGKSLLFNGHMDTVPPGNRPWKARPWAANQEKGRIYGLGTFDMKAGLAAQAGVLCALKQAGLRLGGDLTLESVVDEEWGGGGGTLAARLRGYSADACVISEGTQLEIYRATRGGLVIDLVVEAGDPEAYFSQAEVLSPAIPLGRLLGWVDSWSRKRQKIDKRGPYANFPDPAPVQVLAVESNRLDPEIPLSVPSRGTVRVYFQFLPHENVEAVLRDIRQSLKDFARRDPFFRRYPIAWKPLLSSPLLGHELPLDHLFTQCLADSFQTTMGKAAVITAAPYPCDAFLAHRGFGIPTVLFGPRGAGAHNPDEYVETDSVIQTAEVLLATALQWCGG